jgi:hypothetical protein
MDGVLASNVLAVAVAILFSAAGGALGGIAVGGRVLGNELAAMMGSFYGPLAGVGGVLIGVVVAAIAF